MKFYNTFIIVLLLNPSFAFSQMKPIYKKKLVSPLKLNPVDLTTSFALNTALATSAEIKGQKSLTKSGLVNAWVLGNILYTFGGVEAWSTCALYFLIGTLVTNFKIKEKEKKGIAEKRSGMRGPENVWGSAATSAICCILMNSPLDNGLLKLAFVSSLATKTSDTSASEVGKACGKNCYLLTNFKKVPPGTEGAVSIEGTIAGIVGSVLIGFYGIEIGWVQDWKEFSIVILSSFIATTIESLSGATIQNEKIFTNEFINFINTLVGSIVSVLLSKIDLGSLIN